MVNCEKCGLNTDYYHTLPSGAIVCEDCFGEYEDSCEVDYNEDRGDR